MESLTSEIAAEIARTGPLTFARYCELALYHPEKGYYRAGRIIGRQGDFYTSVSVGPVFGEILAGQFEDTWRKMGEPGEFWVVEQGAHNGQLMADIVSAIDQPFRSACRFGIVEPQPAWRERQAGTLSAVPVQWFECATSLPEFQGVHYSNELVDALPFHLLRSNGSGWEELWVTADGDRLQLTPGPCSPEAGREAARLPVRPAGYLTECRPVAAAWLREVESRLQAGLILVIDYGLTREELLAAHRTEGTFSCYRNHHRDGRPLEDPGNKDITAHVDFTTLAEEAEYLGLHIAGFTDQHHFLVGAAEKLLRSLEGRSDPDAQKTLRSLQTLLHPGTMGTQFHYLAFAKKLPPSFALSGYTYARPARPVLFAGESAA